MDNELRQKQEKAIAYATQPERFDVLSMTLQMRSKHGLRRISYGHGSWHCTCDFFQERNTCSHIMAIQHLLEPLSLEHAPGNSYDSE
jgi:hypothetical protein